MRRTTFHCDPADIAPLYAFVPSNGFENFDRVEAQKYGSEENGAIVPVKRTNDFIFGKKYDSGGAGLASTLEEFVKFLDLLTNMGTGSGYTFLKPGSVELLRTDTLTPTQRKDFNWPQLAGYGYGLGVRTMVDPSKTPVPANKGEFGWCGTVGACAICDPDQKLTVFFLQHLLNPREEYYMPRLREAVYACFSGKKC